MDEPGPERSGGVRLAETRKKDKSKECERSRRLTTTRYSLREYGDEDINEREGTGGYLC